jgi:hypothetical protein
MLHCRRLYVSRPEKTGSLMTGARDAIATGPGSGCLDTQMQDSEVFTGLTGLDTWDLDAKISWLWLWLRWTDHIVETTECRAD